MPELFRDLIRERSLFGVLASLSEACTARADTFRADIGKEPDIHPSVRVMYEDEIAFFDAAADRVTEAHEFLRSDFEGRLPICADGRLELFSQRSSDAAQTYLGSLLSVLSDPKAGRWDRIRAAERLAREADGMIWFSREKGAPDFDVAGKFRKMATMLADPDRSEAEKFEVAEGLYAWISRSAELRSQP
jgi:hypothetical protein